jgi:hypothetical protein
LARTQVASTPLPAPTDSAQATEATSFVKVSGENDEKRERARRKIVLMFDQMAAACGTDKS